MNARHQTDRAMAAPRAFWTFFLSVYVSAGARPYTTSEIQQTENQNWRSLLSKIPITLPEGTDLSNVAIDIKSINIKNCTDAMNQLTFVNGQLREMTLRNNQLDVEAFGLRRDIRQLRVQLAACNSKAVSGSYRAQLYNKLQQLLETTDSDNFLVLKVMALSREVDLLDRRLKQGAANSTETEMNTLRNEWQTKQNELTNLIQQIETGHSGLVLQIIGLQNQIWNLEELRRREGGHQNDRRIKDLQAQLEIKLRDLRGEGGSTAVLLQLVSSNSKITESERLIRILVEESLKNLADKERELKQKSDLLKKKILQLNREERNSELTEEILALQAELGILQQFISNNKNASNHQHQELRALLEFERKQQAALQKQLEDSDYTQAKLIMKILGMMTEVRDLQRDWQQTTTTATQPSALEAQLKAKEQEYAKAQARIRELNLIQREKNDQIAELEERVKQIRTEFEQKMAELNKADEAKIEFATTVLQLQNELVTLEHLISLTTDPQRLAELKKQLQEKLDELSIVNAKIGHDTPEYKIVATILQLQAQIQELKKNGQSGISSEQEKELREQLRIKEEEHSRDQATITALWEKLNQTEAQCSDFEKKITDLQNDLDDKLKKLQAQSTSVTSLALEVSTLTLQRDELQRQLQNTVSKAKVQELQRLLEEKEAELAKKTEELETRSTQPQRFLQIIALQTEIEKLVTVATNSTDFSKIRALEEHLNYLISGIKDETDENSKMVFKVMTLQEKIQRLKNQENSQSEALLKRIKDLEEELEEVRNQIAEKTLVLNTSDLTISNLTAEIMELHGKLQPLEDEISYLQNKHAETIADLQERLALTKTQLRDSQSLLKDADTKNFASIMEIIELREQLKKSQEQATRAAKKSIREVEQQLQTEAEENKKLESSNRALKRKVTELQMCCTDRNAHCEDLQAQLQQSQKDVDRLEQQLQNNQQVSVEQLQMQQELEERTRERNRLRQENLNLRNEKTRAEAELRELRNRIEAEEENKIYPRSMTFDPQTANPRIILSEANTEMRSTGLMQDVPNNPGRFNVLLAALGEPGFSRGRNYWEVSVAGKTCYHLGMASESAPRQGSVDVNPANGFWSIVLNKQGVFRAIDRRPVALTYDRQPNTLGILLDYKRGVVSFYDTAARRHIYSFQGQRFTDKIHPFVNFCEEDTSSTSPIVLITPGSTDWIQ